MVLNIQNSYGYRWLAKSICLWKFHEDIFISGGKSYQLDLFHVLNKKFKENSRVLPNVKIGLRNTVFSVKRKEFKKLF